MMKREYLKPVTEIVDLRINTSIAQTTLHISSDAEQDNDVALARQFQNIDDWSIKDDFIQNTDWDGYLWDDKANGGLSLDCFMQKTQ